jgi:hypothetical protein
VTLLAKLGEENVDYFLATHSPVKNIIPEKGFHAFSHNRRPNEEELYASLMKDWEQQNPDRDISVLIYGEAGTGKSHLINWLKLRCDFDRRHGQLGDLVPVLIRRGSGSLKDALTQLIQQLGDAFSGYLKPVRDALERISIETAREKLLLELALELGTRRKDRNRQTLAEIDRDLKHLGEACKQRGFGGWLARPDGVIDRTIRLLTEQSDTRDRDSRPHFTPEELRVGSEKHKKRTENIPDVLALIDELDDRADLAAKAAEVLNEALDDAVGAVTGLSGGNLDRMLGDIRRDLQAEGKRLALFIEDVSAVSVLDIEVVKAVEPRNDPSMCPILAVMGVTDAGMERLRDNDRQRVTHVASIGKAAVSEWADDRQGLAEFTARYLNAIRFPENEVKKLAAARRETGGDISLSACTLCKRRVECHDAFGSVTLNGVSVGLYPFSTHAPARILERLESDKVLGVSRTPRGFLVHLFNPIVRDTAALEHQEFPRAADLQHVRQGDPPYWSDFTNQFCGDWDDAETQRARLLALFWTDPEIATAADQAHALETIRSLLGLPEFTKKVKAKRRETRDEPRPPEPERREQKPAEGRKLTKLLDGLREWLENKQSLPEESKVRQFLAELVRNCVPWGDSRAIPIAESDRLIRGGAGEKYEHIMVEGQRSRPATTLFFLEVFPRTEETRELIEALARFRDQGSRSWDFDGGELHKRVVSRWLRHNRERIIRALLPPEDLPVDRAVCVAVELLALASIIRRRRSLPDNDAEFLAEILRPRDPEKERVIRCDDKNATWKKLLSDHKDLRTQPGCVVALTPQWQDLAEDLLARHDQLREYLISELEVPQGRTREGANFIDPLPVLRHISAIRTRLAVSPLDVRFQSNFWQSRFTALATAKEYAGLAAALEMEKKAIQKRYQSACRVLTAFGYDTSQPRQDLEVFLTDLLALIDKRREIRYVLPDDAFDALQKSRALRDRSGAWCRSLEEAHALSETDHPAMVIQFDPRNLLDLEDTLLIVEAHLTRLGDDLDAEDQGLSVEGDPEQARDDLLHTLAAVGGQVQEGDDDASEDPDGAAGEPAGAATAEDAGRHDGGIQ